MDEAVRGISFESKPFKLFIGGSTAGNACSMQGISLKVKLSNNLLEAVLQAMLAVCRGIKIKHNMEGYRLWESWSEIKFRR